MPKHWATVDYLIGEVILVIRENMGETAEEKAKKNILKIIAKGGINGVLKGEITRKTQDLRRQSREEYLNDLIEAEEIVAITANTCGMRYLLKEYERS